MLISSQFHNYSGQGCIYCISGGTSCRLPVRFSSEGLSHLGSEEKLLTSGFVLKVMLGGSLCVSVPCTLQPSCGTMHKLV